MGLLKSNTAQSNIPQGNVANKASIPQGNVAKQPVVAQIPEPVDETEVNETASEVETGAKVFVNDLTPETIQAIREKVSAKVEELIASKTLTTMELCHLCFVSPTSIKSRGKTTDSSNEIITGQYAGTKREGTRSTKDIANLSSYIAGLKTAEDFAQFQAISSNPLELAKLLKSLNVKPV